jgi:hypothetical protein
VIGFSHCERSCASKFVYLFIANKACYNLLIIKPFSVLDNLRFHNSEKNLQVGGSGKLKKELLAPFSQEIQNIIRIKKPALPETSFELVS